MEIPLASRSKAQAVKHDREFRAGRADQEIDVHADELLVGRSGQYCVVEPPCPELYRDFYTLRHNPEGDRRHGCGVIRRPFPLVFEQDDAAGEPVSVCFAGLEPLVVDRLRQLGYDVRTTKRRRAFPLPGPLSWEFSETADESLLSLVQQKDRGLIHFDPRRVEPARLIAQVAIAWRRARIVVVTTRISDAWKLRAKLAKFLRPSEITVFTNRTCPTKAGRVAVGTYTQMGVGAVKLHRRHILFALNPTEMLAHACGRDVVRAATAARFYGFVPADQPLSPYYRDLLLALFGGHRVRIPSHGKIERPVDVVFCRLYGGPRMTDDADLVSVKRQGIWEHPLRNRRIVALARALAARDLDEVEQKFPEVFPVLNQFRRARIGILVDNVDHGLTLSWTAPLCSVLAWINCEFVWSCDENVRLDFETQRFCSKSQRASNLTMLA